jgi:hypothetical protein
MSARNALIRALEEIWTPADPHDGPVRVAVSGHDHGADRILAALNRAGYIIVPKPAAVDAATPGVIKFEYTDSGVTRSMAKEVAAKIFD